MEKLYSEWSIVPPFPISKAYSVIGYSVGAISTHFVIPEIGVHLDIGMWCKEVPDVICCTHGHSDHIAALSKNLNDLQTARPTIYAPEEIIDKIRDKVIADFALSTGLSKPKILNKVNFVGLKTYNPIEIKLRGKSWIVEAIKCFHHVPCLGFGFSEKRTRLKEKYSHLKARFKEDPSLNSLFVSSLSELKKSLVDASLDWDTLAEQFKETFGVEIQKDDDFKVDEVYHHPVFCYLGDTSISVLTKDSHKLINKYPVVFIECTYLTHENKKENDKLIKLANKKCHIHWDQLKKELVKAEYQNQTFILYHFSSRYRSNDINTFFAPYLNPESPSYMKNIHPWVCNSE